MTNVQLITITIIGWGIGSLCYKLANDNIHPVMVSTLVTALYLLLTPLSFVIFKPDLQLNIAGITFSLVGGLLMCIGSLAYFFALKRGGAGEITTVTALYPALTLVLSMIFLQEGMSIRKGIGVLLALLSVFILSQK
jgi:bacterial/archaeal transporter family protein